MKALSLLQPWASLLAGGEKTIETRSWKTAERGRIAIHASKTFNEDEVCLSTNQPFVGSLISLGFNKASDLPLGAIIGAAFLYDVRPTVAAKNVISDKEAAFGNYQMGRWAWMFSDFWLLHTPIVCRGMPGVWTVPDGLVGEIERQIQWAKEPK